MRLAVEILSSSLLDLYIKKTVFYERAMILRNLISASCGRKEGEMYTDTFVYETHVFVEAKACAQESRKSEALTYK